MYWKLGKWCSTKAYEYQIRLFNVKHRCIPTRLHNSCLNLLNFTCLQEAWDYFATCVVVVVTFAPVGSLLASHFHRLTLAALIYVLETIALISALIIVRPSLYLTAASAGIILFAFVFYSIIGRIGRRMAEETMKQQEEPLLSISTNGFSGDKNVNVWKKLMHSLPMTKHSLSH